MKESAEWGPLYPQCEAIAAWLHPQAEVALHDLKRDRVVRLWNNFSRRKAGDRSLIAREIQLEPERRVYGPYERSNWDGRRLKCVSVVVDSARRARAGLLCLNLDVSSFDALQAFLQTFTASAERIPEPLIAQDFREQMHTALSDYLRAGGLTLAGLSRADKIEAIRHLDQRHLFATRHAAGHAAGLLGVSRATIYNWLGEARRRAK